MLAGDPEAAERLWRRAYQALDGLGEKGNFSTIAAYLAEAVYVAGTRRRGSGANGDLRVAHVAATTSRRTSRGARCARRSPRGGARAIAARRSPARRSRPQRRRTGRIFAGARTRRSRTCSRRRDGQGREEGGQAGARALRGEGERGRGEHAYAPGSISSRRAMSGSATPCVAGGTTSVIAGLSSRSASSASADALDDRLRDRIRRSLVGDHLVVGGIELEQVVDEHGQARPVGLLEVRGLADDVDLEQDERRGGVGPAAWSTKSVAW